MKTLITLMLTCISWVSNAQNETNEHFVLTELSYSKTPVAKQIKKHPEHFEYLENVQMNRLNYKSDGLNISGYVIQPKEAGNYPCVIFNRGGNRDYGQLLVAHAVGLLAEIANEGYVVLASNYRGVDEGADEFGGADVNDVTNLIKQIASIENADTSKVALLGVSRGGMMNYLTLRRNISSIKASIQIGGITDLDTTIKYHPQIGKVCEELIPNYEERQRHQIKKRSAIHWVADLPKIPQLIIHGTADQSVSYHQIPPFLDSLAAYHIPYTTKIYEGDNHGIKKHQVEMRLEIKKFLAVHLKDS